LKTFEHGAIQSLELEVQVELLKTFFAQSEFGAPSEFAVNIFWLTLRDSPELATNLELGVSLEQNLQRKCFGAGAFFYFILQVLSLGWPRPQMKNQQTKQLKSNGSTQQCR
jgi:hypothetical protein